MVKEFTDNKREFETVRGSALLQRTESREVRLVLRLLGRLVCGFLFHCTGYRILSLLGPLSQVAGHHVHKVKSRLYSLVVVILGDEAQFSSVGQQGNFEGQLLLHRLHLGTCVTADLIVELLGLLAVRPDSLDNGVSHGTIDQGRFDGQSKIT